MDQKKLQKTLKDCKRYGIEINTNIRWERGIEHHEKSIQIFEVLELSDWLFNGDYFCWKSGGDGDNGETLMYALDVYFEMMDKRKME